MAKKKPAAKMPKKPVVKVMTPGKKPVAKAPPKKVAPMAKKVPVKKLATKPVPKKAAPKKFEKKVEKRVEKKAEKKFEKKAEKKFEKKADKKSLASSKPLSRSLKETLLKTATKLLPKAKPLSKEQEKKLREKEKFNTQKERERLAKEASKAKVLAQKEKEKEARDRSKKKDLEKKQKEQEKLRMKDEKEAEKARLKTEKESAKKKIAKGRKGGDEDEEEFDDEDLELGPDDEPAFGEEDSKMARKTEDDDFDEFEEEYKKSKAPKKSGKKAYEIEDAVEAFPVKTGKKFNNAVLVELEGTIADEIAQLREHFNWKEIAEAIGSMDFFIDAKNDECIEKGCDNIRTTQSYCRLHYLRNWKTVQKKREILKEGKLQEYIEELISKYPPKYIEALLSDLSDDKEFYRVLNELNITSEFDFEEDELENAIDDDDADDDLGIETISSSLRYEDE